MLKKFSYALNLILGGVVGTGLVTFIINILNMIYSTNFFKTLNPIWIIAIYAIATVVSIIGFLSLRDMPLKLFKKIGNVLVNMFINIPIADLIFGILGLIIGLVLASLISTLYTGLPFEWLRTTFNVITYIILAYLGIMLPVRRRTDITTAFNIKRLEKKDKNKYVNPKILDTSAIIDGRILDLCRTGFIEGTLVVPEIVLNELRHIADSSDSVKRVRGRRGLDILKIMQVEENLPVVIINNNYNDMAEVDEKLVRIAKDLKGKIITTDFNLNKMAEVHLVKVLNINELAQALKPDVLSGDIMQTTIVKSGKENHQGVAFLDDGTMIVVENGQQYVGKSVSIEITSILQTAAGRMMFAQICE